MVGVILLLCYVIVIYIYLFIYVIFMLCYLCCINDNCFIFKNNVNVEMGI